MTTKRFTPSPRYATKLRLIIVIFALLILAGTVLITALISLDSRKAGDVATTVVAVVAVLDAILCLPALLLVGPYYRSLSYEIQDDEVIVRAGIWTKSVKHVPYRTVTNLTVKRGILDRWLFGLGTLNIQTAGMSGTTGAEESLEGLADVQEVYDIVVRELRRFRGGMTPTAADVEGESAVLATNGLNAILVEIRAIRQALETRGR